MSWQLISITRLWLEASQEEAQTGFSVQHKQNLADIYTQALSPAYISTHFLAPKRWEVAVEHPAT